MGALTERLKSTRPGLRTGSRPMSRDKSDTLLLIFSCVLVIAPHTLHMPVWISLACAAILLWRGWVTFRGLRMPSIWVLLPVALSAFGLVYLRYHMIFGREPGVSLVVLLLTLKLLEMRAKRDLFVVVQVSFFVMLTNFFYSQSMGTALIMALALIAILFITAPLSKSLQPITAPSLTLLSAEGVAIARRGAVVEASVDVAKLPKRVVFVDELPRNTMGKVQKNVLRQQFTDLYAAKVP